MSRLQLPRSPTDALKLADWLEVLALISADENSSKGDLEEALRASSVLERSSREKTGELIEEKCIEVFSEIEQRILSSGAAYPYQLEGGVLQLRPDRAKSHPYLFCLCLSYFDWSTPSSAKKAGIDPRLLFEELCSVAAAHYTSGISMTFGTSRGNSKKAVAAFKKAIDSMCKQLGEGDGFNDSPILHKKDDKIDIVSWRDFNDKRPGKLVLFGQCATGNNWIDKVDEVQPERFWKQWILRPNVSHILRVFYIPHRVDKAYWNYYSSAVGLLFDRCRLAYWAFQGIDTIETDARYHTWCSEALRSETA